MKAKEHVIENKTPAQISQEFDKMISTCGTPDNNNRILVHCAMGISRSAAIVIMYLMKKFSTSFESVFF